jgi:hypothetical protein
MPEVTWKVGSAIVWVKDHIQLTEQVGAVGSDWGQDGWELVSVTHLPGLQPYAVLLTFKLTVVSRDDEDDD